MNSIPPPRRPSSWRSKVTWRRLAAALLIVVIGGYSGYQLRDFVRGPELVIDSPVSGAQLAASAVTVSGRARRIAHLFLNGQRIFTDSGGQFSETLLLAPGYNTITLTTKDKFDRSERRELHLSYNP